MHENYKKFQCQSCDFGFWKIMAGRQLELAEADALLRDRAVGPLEGFRSKLGRPFAAKLKLTDDNEVTFDFGDGADDDERAEAPDFTGQTPLGPCPKCGSDVFEMPQAYVCEKAVGPDKTCDFRSGRMILQRPIERRADGEAARDRQDRSPAVRVGAHAASVLGLSRAAAGRQDRLRVRERAPKGDAAKSGAKTDAKAEAKPAVKRRAAGK